MKINYQETPTDLLRRIDIHSQYGSQDIDKWMLEVIPLNKGVKILDVGCGSGKQCFSFYDRLNGKCEITGGDVSGPLLDKARQIKQEGNANINFMELDFNKRFPFEDNEFDLASCSFAIYYAEDIPFTISEMHRVLKPGGKLFTTGPMPENKQLFYDIIKDATKISIPPMPGSSRYSSQIYAAIEEIFSNVETHIFENPLTFPVVDPFIDYTRASLSEDRKLWTSLFNSKDEFEMLMDKITDAAQHHLRTEGNLIMTKVVGGFLAGK
jgi:ubiquinone/menaquinone biosynthesis C-methylase UbiE